MPTAVSATVAPERLRQRDVDWNAILSVVKNAYVAKGQESSLTDDAQRNKVIERGRLFHKAAALTGAWIDQYLPDPDGTDRVGFIEAEFQYGVYSQYAAEFPNAHHAYEKVRGACNRLSANDRTVPKFGPSAVCDLVSAKLDQLDHPPQDSGRYLPGYHLKDEGWGVDEVRERRGLSELMYAPSAAFKAARGRLSSMQAGYVLCNVCGTLNTYYKNAPALIDVTAALPPNPDAEGPPDRMPGAPAADPAAPH